MKGLQTKTESDVVFLAVKHNSLVQESKGPRDGFEEIEVENPRNKQKVRKYIRRYSACEGMVTKIEWYDTEQKYENRYQGWKIHMEAKDVPVVLDLPFASIPSSRFMKLAENVDWTKPVEFRAWKDRNGDKTAFWVGQNNESVPQKYTRGNPGECPPPEQNFKGDWVYDKQVEFLYRRMKDAVIPAVQQANEWRVQGETKPAGSDSQELAKSPAESDNGEFDYQELKERIYELADQVVGKTDRDVMAEYFGADRWEQIEEMPVAILKTVRAKIIDDITPF